MIPYIIGAAIGFVVNELINEDKIKKLQEKSQEPTVINPTIDGTQTIDPPQNDSQVQEEEEVKEVKFVAKSRGKKK